METRDVKDVLKDVLNHLATISRPPSRLLGRECSRTPDRPDVAGLGVPSERHENFSRIQRATAETFDCFDELTAAQVLRYVDLLCLYEFRPFCL